MGVYDNFSIPTSTEYVSTYRGQPLDAVKELGQGLNQKYYGNMENYGKIRQLADSMTVLGGDEGINSQAIEGIDKIVQDVANNEGAWENATGALMNASVGLSSNKQLKDAMSAKVSADAHIANIQKQYDKGDIDQTQYQYAMDQLRNYKGIGAGDAIGNHLYTPAKYIEVGKVASEFSKNWKSEARESQWTQDADGNWRQSNGKFIDPEEVQNGVIEHLMSNDQAVAYAADKLRMQGIEPTSESIIDYFRPIAVAEGRKLGFTETGQDFRLGHQKGDPTDIMRGGIPFDMIYNTPSTGFKTSGDVKNKVIGLDEQIRTLTSQLGNSAFNQNDVKAGIQQAHAQREAAIKIQSDAEKQVRLKHPGIEEGTISDEQKGAAKAQFKSVAQAAGMSGTGLSQIKSDEDIQDNADAMYDNWLSKEDPFAAAVNKQMKEWDRTNTTTVQVYPIGDKALTSSLDRSLEMQFGRGSKTAGAKGAGGIGKEGADAVTAGLTWLSGKGAGNDMEPGDFKDIHHVESGGVYIEPGTGEVKMAVKVVYPDGSTRMAGKPMDPQTMDIIYKQSGAKTVTNMYVKQVDQLHNPEVPYILSKITDPKTGGAVNVKVSLNRATDEYVITYKPGTAIEVVRQFDNKYDVSKILANGTATYNQSKR